MQLITGRYIPIQTYPEHGHPPLMIPLQCSAKLEYLFFILISAYFLAFNKKNPIPRLIRLWIQIFIYSASIFVVYALLRRTPLIPTNLREEISPNMVLTSFFPITFNAYWFMSAFCVLILLAPFITILFDQLSKRQTLVLISIMFWMTFVWKLLNPTNQYFTDVIYLTTIFMIGSFIRRYISEFPKIKIWHLLITIILGFLSVFLVLILLNPKLFCKNIIMPIFLQRDLELPRSSPLLLLQSSSFG